MKDSNGRGIDIEACYARYGPMVLRRCRAMLRDEQAAFDAAQEVFLKVLSRRGRMTGDYPSALLYRIATNTCLNRIRDDKKHDLLKYVHILRRDCPDGDPGGGGAARNVLEHILARERGTTRRIAVMYFIEGMTLKEIGAAANLSVSGVHKRLDRLRRKIRIAGDT
jgi:RNA polymerase sigma-70 factor (ECF subfamily)